LEEIAMIRFAAIGVLAVLSALTIPVAAQQKAAATSPLVTIAGRVDSA